MGITKTYSSLGFKVMLHRIAHQSGSSGCGQRYVAPTKTHRTAKGHAGVSALRKGSRDNRSYGLFKRKNRAGKVAGTCAGLLVPLGALIQLVAERPVVICNTQSVTLAGFQETRTMSGLGVRSILNCGNTSYKYADPALLVPVSSR